MNILVLTIHADPTIHPGAGEGGGTHMYVNELMNLLIYRGVSALFITRKASPGADYYEYGPVKLYRIGIGPEQHWDKTNLVELENEINERIEQVLLCNNFKPSLVHSIYWCSGRAALSFSNKYGIPFIHTIISNGLRKRNSGYPVLDQQVLTEQKVFDKASVLITVSNQEKNDLQSFYGVPKDKIKVIGRGVDNIFLSALYDKNGTLIPRDKPNTW